jgi:hypothetical protein
MTRLSTSTPSFKSRHTVMTGARSRKSKLVGSVQFKLTNRLLDGDFQKPRNGRKNDKAHPPIHPTANAGDLAGDEKRVFDLIARRFLASCHRNAEGKTTTVEIDIAGELFSTSGKLSSSLIPKLMYRSGRTSTKLPRGLPLRQVGVKRRTRFPGGRAIHAFSTGSQGWKDVQTESSNGSRLGWVDGQEWYR